MAVLACTILRGINVVVSGLDVAMVALFQDKLVHVVLLFLQMRVQCFLECACARNAADSSGQSVPNL